MAEVPNDPVAEASQLGTLTQTNEKSDPTLFSMYVIDYIADPQSLTPGALGRLKDCGVDDATLKKIPQGTIIAKYDKQSQGVIVVLPFFSCHFSLPIKAGEFIWCTKDDKTQHFYLSRKCTIGKYEDPNYAPQVRINEIKPPSGGQQTQALFDGETTENQSASSHSFPPICDNPSPNISKILNLSNTDANSSFKGEAVPRYKTKPADFSIQGSNNTLIELGTDSSTTLKEKIGCITITSGLGQTPATAPAEKVMNGRGYYETNKESAVQNLAEGKYDYANDSSRIIISMNSDIDKLFGFQPTTPNGEALQDIISLDEKIINTSYPKLDDNDVTSAPAIVSKSTNQLMIGRAEGTIRIVHESGSSIVMDENGNIQIQCGPEGQIRIGSTDASIEPAVLGETLNEMILAVVNEMITLAPTFVATGVGPGILSPVILTALSNFKTKLEAKENLSDITKVE
jgi:hypothetical protein